MEALLAAGKEHHIQIGHCLWYLQFGLSVYQVLAQRTPQALALADHRPAQL